MTEFGSLNHSPGKRVLNNLKTISHFLHLEGCNTEIAVIKLRVNNRCGNGTGSFNIITSAKEVMFSLCLFVTRIPKFGGYLAHWRWKNPLDFGDNADHIMLGLGLD